MRGMALCFLPPRLCFLPQADTRGIRPRSELHFVEVGEPRYSKLGFGSAFTPVLGLVCSLSGSLRPAGCAGQAFKHKSCRSDHASIYTASSKHTSPAGRKVLRRRQFIADGHDGIAP